VLAGHVVDQFHDDDGLAHAGAAEQAHLAALHEGGQQVDDLDAGFENFGGGLLLGQRRRVAVYRQEFLGIDRAAVVLGLAQHVHQAAQAGVADGHLQRRAGVFGLQALAEPRRRTQRDGAHGVVAQMLRDLGHQRLLGAVLFILDAQRVEDARQLALLELYVQHRPDYLHNFSGVHS